MLTADLFEDRREKAARKYEEKALEKTLKGFEYPENLNETEMLDFIYLRVCLYINVKPMGDFQGAAKICAEVMQNGGDIVDMYRAGVNPVYAACLSAHGLNGELQKEIIDTRVPF